MDPISSLPNVTLSLQLHDLVALIALFILGVYAIFSAVFYYHWSTFATDGKVKNITIAAFFLTTIPLLIIIGITAMIIR